MPCSQNEKIPFEKVLYASDEKYNTTQQIIQPIQIGRGRSKGCIMKRVMGH